MNKHLCIYVLCLALISPALTSSISSSSSSTSSNSAAASSISQQVAKPEESKLKADAKDLIKASASANDYTQLAADYAVEKHQQHNQHSDGLNVPEPQSSYSQPLSTGVGGYSQPLAYSQSLSYQQVPPHTSEAQSQYEVAAAPGAPGYEQPGSAAVADAYTNAQQGDGGQAYGDGQGQYSQQYPPAQQYQPMGQNYQQVGPAYQQASGPAYQPTVNGYSQPLDGNYGHQGPSAVYNHQPSIQNIPGHSYSEVTYTQANGDYNNQQQNGYQQLGAYSTNPSDGYAQNGPESGSYSGHSQKPKKTVILAIPVKLVPKGNKYAHEQPQYNHVQPAAAGLTVSHQNQDSHDNSGNSYYSTNFATQHDKPVYTEKNEQPRIPNDYSETIEKDNSHGPKAHVNLSPISHNHLQVAPKQYVLAGGKPNLGRPQRGPKPYGGDEYEINGGIEENPIEIGHEQLSYGPPASEMDPAALQSLSYLPQDPFGGYGGPHGAVGPHPSMGGFNGGNPMEILYQPQNVPYGKGPSHGGPFGYGKPLLSFGGSRGPSMGGYGPPPHASASHQQQGGASSLGSNYGQLLNTLLSAYGLGGSSKGSSGKPSSGLGGSGGGGKGITSYFNNYGLDGLLKGYSQLAPNYLSSLYSSASSPTKMYLPPGAQMSMSMPQPKPFAMYPQLTQHQHHQHQGKPKQSGLMTAPSNIVSAFEEMFKSTLNPVSKFRRPLYSDATKAITNFYKKLIN